jgi:hypothetical protein
MPDARIPKICTSIWKRFSLPANNVTIPRLLGKPVVVGGLGERGDISAKIWSGKEDSNLRPLPPEGIPV